MPLGVYSKSGAYNVRIVDDNGTFGSTTGTQSSVAGSATDVTILAANTNRKGFMVFNDSAAILYLLIGAGTSSTTVFSIRLDPYSTYEAYSSANIYTGILKGIWSSATGSARVTEFT